MENIKIKTTGEVNRKTTIKLGGETYHAAHTITPDKKRIFKEFDGSRSILYEGVRYFPVKK